MYWSLVIDLILFIYWSLFIKVYLLIAWSADWLSISKALFMVKINNIWIHFKNQNSYCINVTMKSFNFIYDPRCNLFRKIYNINEISIYCFGHIDHSITYSSETHQIKPYQNVHWLDLSTCSPTAATKKNPVKMRVKPLGPEKMMSSPDLKLNKTPNKVRLTFTFPSLNTVSWERVQPEWQVISQLRLWWSLKSRWQLMSPW